MVSFLLHSSFCKTRGYENNVFNNNFVSHDSQPIGIFDIGKLQQLISVASDVVLPLHSRKRVKKKKKKRRNRNDLSRRACDYHREPFSDIHNLTNNNGVKSRSGRYTSLPTILIRAGRASWFSRCARARKSRSNECIRVSRRCVLVNYRASRKYGACLMNVDEST